LLRGFLLVQSQRFLSLLSKPTATLSERKLQKSPAIFETHWGFRSKFFAADHHSLLQSILRFLRTGSQYKPKPRYNHDFRLPGQPDLRAG
jgi:hypothetical protein